MFDKVFFNGKIYSMEQEGEYFDAVAIRDGKIARTFLPGEEIPRDAEEMIDLKGRTMLPGFIDCHMHLLSYTQSLQSVSLRGVRSWAECKKKLLERKAVTPKGEWIRGAQFNHEIWEDGAVLPTREELDSISSEHPIIIGRYCMHVHCCNTMALQLAGIDRDHLPGAENSVLLDENGDPNGILLEDAVSPVLAVIPDKLSTFEAKKDAEAEVIKELNSHGIVGAHPIQGKFCDAKEYLDIYQVLEKEGRLSCRMYVSFDEYPVFSMRSGFGSDMLKYGFFKIYSDGSLGSRGAALYEEYSDAPGVYGVVNYPQEVMNEMVQKAYDMGLQVAIHAIGDKGLDIALTAIEKAYFANPKPDQRFRLIHVMVVNEDLIARMKKLPVILDIQPMFVATDASWAEERLGPERGKYSFMWRRLIDEGFMLTGSSDSPVEIYDPLMGAYAITTRKNLDGLPAEGYHPEQRVTTFEALSMYTRNAAYATFEEDVKGTIREGKFADLVILDGDPFAVPPEKLLDIHVEATYLGGKAVYQKEN